MESHALLVTWMNKKTYIAVGKLVQDLRAANEAAINAIQIAGITGNKWRTRFIRQAVKIRSELRFYEPQINNGFVMIPYSGCLISKYKDAK